MPPLTIVEYSVDVDPIAGPTKYRGSTKAIKCAWNRLAFEGRGVPSWGLADALCASGYAGMLVRSFAPGATSSDRNLVPWRWGDALPTKVTVFDPDGRLAGSSG